VPEGKPMETRRGTPSSLLDLPVNEEICFTTNKGKYSEKIMKQQTKILKSFSPFLKKILDPGEEIFLAVKATSPTAVLEQFTIGWMFVYIKRCMLIFTNKRILHFPTRANFSLKPSVAQIVYGDIEEVKLSGFLGRTLKMEYKSGKKEKFHYIPSREFKKLRTLIPNLATGAHPSAVMERYHLCPKCIAPLQKDVFSCPSCHLEFKNLKQAIRLSLLFPGGGYFYAGHPMMGIGDAIVETVLIITLISVFIGAFTSPNPSAAWATIIPVAFFLSLEKMITIYDTKHFINEYIPADKNAVSKF
jgi:TM2 domain-containing membrane protein YozV